MFKFMIPMLSIALLCNSIATAQYFGTQYPSSSGHLQSTPPIPMARATDTPPVAGPSQTLHDLGPLALPGLPEPLALPKPADLNQLAVPEQACDGQPETSANDFIVKLATRPVTALPSPTDFSEATHQQLYHNFAQAAQQPIAAQDAPSARHHGGFSDVGCGFCQATLPYRTPILPPSNSFHGHFRSNPCYFDLWANYPAEAAAACAHNRAKLTPTRHGGRKTCQ